MTVRTGELLALAVALCWLAPARGEDCAPTRNDSLGPYYISGTPVLESLNRFGKPGEPMRITGEIRSSEPPHHPLPGARVKIWQTDGTGRYHPAGNGDFADYKDRDIDMRGTIIADDKGQFSVLSLVPDDYGSRPPHIHYRISAPEHRTLVTQHYPGTRRARDPCRSAPVNRSLDVTHFPAPTIFLQPGR